MCMSSPKFPKAKTFGRGVLAVAERTGNTNQSGYKELKEKVGSSASSKSKAAQTPIKKRQPSINMGGGSNGSGVGLNI